MSVFCLVLFELLMETTITLSSVRFCLLNKQPQGDTAVFRPTFVFCLCRNLVWTGFRVGMGAWWGSCLVGGAITEFGWRSTNWIFSALQPWEFQTKLIVNRPTGWKYWSSKVEEVKQQQLHHSDFQSNFLEIVVEEEVTVLLPVW